MKALLYKDLIQLFASPLAWILLAIEQFVLAWIFLLQLDQFQAVQTRIGLNPNQAVIQPLYLNAALILLFIVPLLGMLGFSLERRNGALDLLLSSPASPTALVFGRFIALLAWLLPAILLCLVMATSLALGAAIDLPRLFAGAFALLLCAALYAALTIWLSTLGDQPLATAAAAIGAILLLWLIGDSGAAGGVFSWLGIEAHFTRLAAGDLNAGDLGYFLALGCGALLAATFQLQRSRET